MNKSHAVAFSNIDHQGESEALKTLRRAQRGLHENHPLERISVDNPG